MLQEDLLLITEKSTERANKKKYEGPDLKEGEMVYLLRKNIKTKRPNDKLDHTKLGPFKIKKQKGPVTFELELPKTMRIHPVFHKSLLEPCHSTNARPGPVEIDEETQEPRYEVEQVLDCRPIGGQPHYLVKWSGYDHSENTWEPESHLTRESVRSYQQRHPEELKDPKKW